LDTTLHRKKMMSECMLFAYWGNTIEYTT